MNKEQVIEHIKLKIPKITKIEVLETWSYCVKLKIYSGEAWATFTFALPAYRSDKGAILGLIKQAIKEREKAKSV